MYKNSRLVGFFPQRQKLKAEYRTLIGSWSHKSMFYVE